MNMWAGSWLIASVVIERMRQISSITDPMCGNRCADLGPLLAKRLERVLRAETKQLLSLELGELLAPGKAFRHRLAVHRGELRLGVESLQMRRAARHRQPDHSPGSLRQRQRAEHATRWRRPGAATDGAARARATAETLRILPRKARRVYDGKGSDLIIVRSSNKTVRFQCFLCVRSGSDRLRHVSLFQARIPRMTVGRSTPVSLASRPWNLTLKASWLIPSWWSIVACRSCTVHTSWAAA